MNSQSTTRRPSVRRRDSNSRGASSNLDGIACAARSPPGALWPAVRAPICSLTAHMTSILIAPGQIPLVTATGTAAARGRCLLVLDPALLLPPIRQQGRRESFSGATHASRALLDAILARFAVAVWSDLPRARLLTVLESLFTAEQVPHDGDLLLLLLLIAPDGC